MASSFKSLDLKGFLKGFFQIGFFEVGEEAYLHSGRGPQLPRTMVRFWLPWGCCSFGAYCSPLGEA